MQSELPLWSSGLESLKYADPFPKFPKAGTNSPDKMEDDEQLTQEISGTDEEKGWRFYIGSICNRRTVNDMLEDMWRRGEQAWVTDVAGIVEKTSQAEKVLFHWYVSSSPPSSDLLLPGYPLTRHPGTKCQRADSPIQHKPTKI
jgi:hypothetical protein